MSWKPDGNEACCPPNADGITYLKVGSQGRTVGMMNLDLIFKQLSNMGRLPEDASDNELLGMARKFNYIPAKESIQADYAAALRRAYSTFCNSQTNKETQ